MADAIPDTSLAAAQPPDSRLGLWGWMRANLFASPLSAAITLGVAYLLYRVVPPALDWLIFSADWYGTTDADCTGEGACWVFVRVHLGQFLYGFYPEDQRWRVNVGFAIMAVAGALLFLRGVRRRPLVAAALLVLAPAASLSLFSGGFAGLEHVPTRYWGGLMVTLIVGVVGVAFSTPLGTLLALGRRARMPLVRTFCIAYIEFWRGVPLLGVLFMAVLFVPLILPQGMNLPRFAAAVIGVVLYAAAFIAEVVRGGLQGLERTQYEAAEALGLGYWQRMRLIVLPQAYRNVIPALVSTFINLFKSSTLVLVIGLFDVLGIVQNAVQNPDWPRYIMEGYVFAAAFFWTICFSISRYSRRLERRLGRSADTVDQMR